jgi:hypothetical protein
MLGGTPRDSEEPLLAVLVSTYNKKTGTRPAIRSS